MNKCICEHVEDHHRQIGPLNPLALTGCEWRGCGCPRFILMPKEPSVFTTPAVTTKEYELVKENSIINRRFLEAGALSWPDPPIPIFNTDFVQPLGSIKTIRRENGVIYGTSHDFFEDVNFSIEITNIEVEYEAKRDEFPRIIKGLIRAAVII